jgi:hypothetical protein
LSLGLARNSCDELGAGGQVGAIAYSIGRPPTAVLDQVRPTARCGESAPRPSVEP